jgi:hypothetical protein
MFKKWHDIDSLSHVIRSRNQSDWMKSVGEVTYYPKIKLHGTNASIRITPEGIFPQSRSRILTLEHDNYGFAAWLKAHEAQFESLLTTVQYLSFDVTIYGEWFGPGVQSGVASSQTDKKHFAVFAMEVVGSDGQIAFTSDPLVLACAIIISFETFHILPWAYEPIKVNFEDPTSLANFADIVNGHVQECEKVDPWIKQKFGIEGPGEGFVYYANPHDANPYLKGFMFKAKGEEHRVNKTKSAATVNPELLKSVGAFVDFSVTEARLQQGFREAVNEVAEPKLTPDFLRWVANDILKECTDELVSNGLEWKQVASQVSKKAREWYFERMKVVV